jgi:RNA polymerase sigma-70 factor (ECF subfamily)
MTIKGSAGAFYMDGEIDHTLSMAIDGEKMAAIYIVRNPDNLRPCTRCGGAGTS